MNVSVKLALNQECANKRTCEWIQGLLFCSSCVCPHWVDGPREEGESKNNFVGDDNDEYTKALVCAYQDTSSCTISSFVARSSAQISTLTIKRTLTIGGDAAIFGWIGRALSIRHGSQPFRVVSFTFARREVVIPPFGHALERYALSAALAQGCAFNSHNNSISFVLGFLPHPWAAFTDNGAACVFCRRRYILRTVLRI